MSCKNKLLTTLFLLALIPLRAPAQSMTEAMQSYFNLDLKKMQGQLEAIISKPQNQKDWGSAHVYLALLEWRFYQNHGKARATIAYGLRGKEKHYELNTMRARLELDAGNFPAAEQAALSAQQAAKTRVDKNEAFILSSKITVQEAFHMWCHPESGGIDRASLSQALHSLRKIIRSDPGLLKPSRLLLKAGLLADNGQAALEGLISYYSLFLFESDHDLLSGPLQTIKIILPSWKGPQTDIKDRIRLATALAEVKMFEEAAIAVRDPRVKWDPPPELKRILHYAGFVAKIKEVSDAYYRASSVGDSAFPEYQNIIHDALVTLWNQSLFPDEKIDRETFDQNRDAFMDRFIEEIGREYGAYFRLSGSGRARDLYYGHVITAKNMDIEQYGHSVPVRFIFLDSMVSLGFRSWVFDFRSQVGGWARDNSIYILRPAFASQPLDAWSELHDSEKRKEQEERIAEDNQKDWAIAAKDPFAYLPGLHARLQRDSKLKILKHAHQGPGDESLIRQRFISIYSQTVIESICLAHEGRHIIDHEILDIQSGKELEFRAKLSEVVFCDFPKLVLCHIVSPNIGSYSSHGQANLEIMKRLVAWLQAHADEVPGLDTDKPLLPQMDLMTDEQIRRAFRSMDPLAGGGEESELENRGVENTSTISGSTGICNPGL